jgi:hypothetical protein
MSVLKQALTLLGMLAFGLMFAVLFVEFMAGCGETYIDAKGERHQYECVFIGKSASEWMR